MLFKVASRYNKSQIYDVYAVSNYDDNYGKTPYFLIYDNDRWRWEIASIFVPLAEARSQSNFTEVGNTFLPPIKDF